MKKFDARRAEFPCPVSNSPSTSLTWKRQWPSTPPSLGLSGQDTRLDHLGVEVETTTQVDAAASRLKEAGLATIEETNVACCYAVQDKVWVYGPGKEPWEVYVVKGDSGQRDKAIDTSTPSQPADCCRR